MAQLNLVWTETAIRQRNIIFKYWNERNQSREYSKKLRTEITHRTTQLLKHPKLGKNVDFKNTRVVSLGHFSIFYQHISNRIIITAFWDNRNDPGKLITLLK